MFYSFLLLNNFTLYVCVLFCLFIHLLRDMCVVSTLNHVSANGVLRVCESVVCVGMEDDMLGLS